NETLRKSLEGKGASKLYQVLRYKYPEKALLLNESDKKNPRRLIRAIEVSDWKLQNNQYNQLSSKTSYKYDSLFVGLCLPRN
ncbi:MAG: hypothetical protein NZM26_03510, partial [Patescibacteria group bacterium]|nr:hypothetical protein [Patescibacteria group bacterium]